MPVQIENKYHTITLNELVAQMRAGYSVRKTPHVGNQHPSNLVCAALGIPLEMVSVTQGHRDTNFHPQLRIAGGVATPLYDGNVWTPFARLSDGTSSTAFHQASVQNVFPQTEVITDLEVMQQYADLAEVVFRQMNTAVHSLFYRRFTADGTEEKVRTCDHLPEADLSDLFGFTNQSSGWIIPNRMHLVFEFVYQALSSGRDVVYALSGPDMVGYIEKQQRCFTLAYDAIRQEQTDLPETLTVRIVPVADCRFVTHVSRADSLSAVQDVVRWYEALPGPERRHAGARFTELVQSYPEFTLPIESAATLSQYDLTLADDLLLDPWMLDTPLSRVSAIYRRLQVTAKAVNRQMAAE